MKSQRLLFFGYFLVIILEFQNVPDVTIMYPTTKDLRT